MQPTISAGTIPECPMILSSLAQGLYTGERDWTVVPVVLISGHIVLLLANQRPDLNHVFKRK